MANIYDAEKYASQIALGAVKNHIPSSLASERKVVKKLKFNRLLRILGPGLITGAADDDPSGIATYSQTGAQFGFGMLWTSLYQIPLLIAVQETCGRIGAVTGKGIAGVVKEHYTRKVLYGIVMLVVVANIINLGTDIGAVASATQLVVNVPFVAIAISIALIIALLEIFVTYKTYAKILKWLALALLSYPITALIIHEPWGHIVQATLVPHISLTFGFLFIITGVFGTTISPYMFFWQSSGEVEEEVAAHMVAQRGGVPRLTKRFMRNLRIDTAFGMLASEITQWFIIIATATVLFSHGIHNINTAAQAAKALQPLVNSFPDSGQLAKDIFAVGIIGLGFLAIPVLAGSAAYAMSEAFGWKAGLYRKFSKAKGFYGVIIVATLIGLMINFLGINPIKALVFTAVFNGVASVPLIFLLAKINGNKNIMGEHIGGKLSRTIVWLTFAVMGAAAIAMFYTLAK
ncbi:MAG: NRAMP family divalent metal transporter [Candidatus Saccharimonadales bacterium]